MSRKFCPLKFNANQTVTNTSYLCIEEECAWWDEDEGCCAINNIAAIPYILFDIQKDLRQA